MLPLRATPGSPRAARCRAGPAHVEEVTAPVTPCRGSPGPTVRDACGCTRGSAAPGGDVPGCYGHRRGLGGTDAPSAGRRTLRPERCGEFSTNNVDYSTRPALGVLQVQALLGPDLTSRDEEALVAGH